ncbi:unnamed protein product [Protopolystoma xenopodis]|uniref:Uncharacterized protein n=1 Tax=Protopolystoma xenopodis TaxID=117903 RepID=A0A448X382_9PLAT|nr:unnamed protein product [Protopolystoma xenopodis]
MSAELDMVIEIRCQLERLFEPFTVVPLCQSGSCPCRHSTGSLGEVTSSVTSSGSNLSSVLSSLLPSGLSSPLTPSSSVLPSILPVSSSASNTSGIPATVNTTTSATGDSGQPTVSEAIGKRRGRKPTLPLLNPVSGQQPTTLQAAPMAMHSNHEPGCYVILRPPPGCSAAWADLAHPDTLVSITFNNRYEALGYIILFFVLSRFSKHPADWIYDKYSHYFLS